MDSMVIMACFQKWSRYSYHLKINITECSPGVRLNVSSFRRYHEIRHTVTAIGLRANNNISTTSSRSMEYFETPIAAPGLGNSSQVEPSWIPTGWGFAGPRTYWTTCISEQNDYLKNSTQIDQWASAVATTLMTVLPSLIAFSPLKTADIQTLHYLDVIVALMTCGFTLFFRVDSWTTLRKDKIWKVKDILDGADIETIYCHKGSGTGMKIGGKGKGVSDHISSLQPLIAISAGAVVQSSGSSSQPLPDSAARLRKPYDGGRLQKLQNDASGKVISESLHDPESGSGATTVIGQKWYTALKQPRPPRGAVYLIVTAFSIVQIFLYLVIAGLVTWIDSTIFIWSCPRPSYIIYVCISMSSLFLTLAFVATFVSVIAFSRLASIQLCAWMEKHLGLTIIEYETEREWVAIWFVINSMPGCIVESQNSSYRYVNGYLPHTCTDTEDPGTDTRGADTGTLGQQNIPMPNTEMLKTATQVPDIRMACTFCSAILGFLFALCLGIISGIVVSYASIKELSVTFVGMIGATFGTIGFVLFVWRLWCELESAAGHGQALQWAEGCDTEK
ncbi:hypothetical protein C7212DRAFT_366523 [Tuber magnatum]|uniref:Transmembrane protein n=1 Tax=Tuber magnatum TaxID=42249 RepID=A0A317SGT1_9PEZI|nr:hypothetical protein C7212DRAFT_366523 [Tuber magnatum]